MQAALHRDAQREVAVPGTARVVYDPAPGAEARLAQALLQALPQLRGGAAVLGLVTDDRVRALHGARFREALSGAGVRLAEVVVPAGESSKSLSQVELVAQSLVAGGVDRGGAVLALGGGVVSDLAGLVAALLLRGVPWVVSPTTVMAQADAALGGKTAVNLPQGKNLLGCFHMPLLVYADLTTLATLEPAERIAGLAEVVKHALLMPDGALWALLHAHAEALRDGDVGLLRDVLWHCGRFKSEVVAADPRELDPAGRVLLNLGHTVGHALEITGPLRHGEAVALGLLAAARVGARLGLGPPDLERGLADLLHRLGLPTDLDRRLWAPPGSVPGGGGPLLPEVLRALGVDKKRAGAQVRYVVAARHGAGFAGRVAPISVPQLVDLLAAPEAPPRVLPVT